MFLLDDLLLAPGKAVMFLFEELARKAQEDFLDDDSVKQELQEIYALLDSGKISGNEFDSRESQLLAHLEQIARAKFPNNWGAPADPTRQIEAYVPSAEDETVAGQPFIDVIESRPVAVESVGDSQGVAAQPPAVEDRASQPLPPTVNVMTMLRRLLESSPPAPRPAERDEREAHEATRDQANLERIMRWREQKQPAQVAAPPVKPLSPTPPVPYASSIFEQQALEVIESGPIMAVGGLGGSDCLAAQPLAVDARGSGPLGPDSNIMTLLRRLLESSRPSLSRDDRDDGEAHESRRDQENLDRINRWREQKQPAQAAAPAVESLPPPTPVTYASATFERHAVPVMASLTMSQVIDSTVRGLSLLKLKVSTVSSVSRDENGWRVTAELVERKSVPDTSDLLGVYELHLDEAGNILRYERTRMRRRSDLGRS